MSYYQYLFCVMATTSKLFWQKNSKRLLKNSPLFFLHFLNIHLSLLFFVPVWAAEHGSEIEHGRSASCETQGSGSSDRFDQSLPDFVAVTHEAMTMAIQDMKYRFPLAFKRNDTKCLQLIGDACQNCMYDEDADLVDTERMFAYIKEKLTKVEETLTVQGRLRIKAKPGKSCGRLSCKHIFHKHCILTVLQSASTTQQAAACPLCRKQSVPKEVRYINPRRKKGKKTLCAICLMRMR